MSCPQKYWQIEVQPPAKTYRFWTEKRRIAKCEATSPQTASPHLPKIDMAKVLAAVKSRKNTDVEVTRGLEK